MDNGKLNDVNHFLNENSLHQCRQKKGEWYSLICKSISVLAKKVPKMIFTGSVTVNCSTKKLCIQNDYVRSS